MMQSCLLPRLLLVLLMASVAASVDADESRRRLNVLLILADDLNCALGCYGQPDVQTPNLDRLAARGLRFDRAYCQQAVCNPSRASLLTGLRPDSIRVWDLRTDFRSARPDAVTLPQYFRQHGYHAQGIGKVFHNTGDLDDEVTWSVPAQFHAGRHQDEFLLPTSTSATGAKLTWFESEEVPDDAYRDGRIAAAAVETLGQLRERPFFLAVGFWRPHLPFLSPRQDWERYSRTGLTPPGGAPRTSSGWTLLPPEGVPDVALHDSRELHNHNVSRPVSEDLVPDLWRGYYAGITYLDRNVGKVLDALEATGLADRTIVVFTSDHGFHLGQHGLWCKTSCFELDARVPLLLSFPSQGTAGAATGALVELIDLYPTLVELCGLPAAAGLDGVSLVPLLDDPHRSVKSAALTQHPRPAYYREAPDAMGYSLRTEHHRYTEWRRWSDGNVLARELYDHRTDPHESRNLAAQSGEAHQMQELADRLQAMISGSR